VKISHLESILVEVPLHEPVTGVHGVTTVRRSVRVHAVTDAGQEGWRNVDPTPGYPKVSARGIHVAGGRLAPALAGMECSMCTACSRRRSTRSFAR